MHHHECSFGHAGTRCSNILSDYGVRPSFFFWYSKVMMASTTDKAVIDSPIDGGTNYDEFKL
jgi:hypothetical protein